MNKTKIISKIAEKTIPKNKQENHNQEIFSLLVQLFISFFKQLEKMGIDIEEDAFAQNARVFIEQYEGFSSDVYYDSEKIPHIGFGFNLSDKSTFFLVKPKIQEEGLLFETIEAFTFKKEDGKYKLKKNNENLEVFGELKDKFDIQDKKQLNDFLITTKEKLADGANDKYLKSILKENLPFHINKQEAQKILRLLIDKKRLDLAKKIYKPIPKVTNNKVKEELAIEEHKKNLNSYEDLVILSLYYNTPKLIGEGLRTALKENNRFKVWFEIRYRSNGGKSKGIAKRRFAESNIFGLFDGVERGGFDNTAEWSKKHTPTLQEMIEFMKFLYSPFRKEYDARVKENGQTKLIKKTTNNYIDYIKAYETEMVFEGITLDEYDDSDFNNHYVPYQEWFDKLFILLPTSSYHFSLSSISVFSQPLFHPNTSTPNITATESIKIALNPINKRLNQIRGNASLPNEAFFISTGLYTPKASIDNQGLVTHILLDTSSHFDCDSFTHPQNIIFYIVLCDRLGLNAKIIKLEGCSKALVEVEDHQIGMIGKKFNGLIQINNKEGVIYCFEKEADGKNSPNLTIYDSFSSTPLVTIFNLRSEGNSNA